MSPARRSHRKRDWPRGMYEPRPGYYVWRHPDTGVTMAIGRVTFAAARNSALEANDFAAAARPSLIERMVGAAHTVAQLLDKMPAAANKNTSATWRTLDKTIRAKLGPIACSLLKVQDCAAVIEEIEDSGKTRTAEALRSRLLAICRRGQQLGWMDSNPAEPTRAPTVTVKRGRLTLESFLAIHAKAAEAAEWLPQAMMLALITGADRSTIAGLQRADVASGYLTITRPKTKARVAIPLALRMDCVGVSLADLVQHRTGVLSKYLVHHVNSWGNAPAGSPVFVDGISKAFTRARELAGIPDEGAPTFHEIRSLAKRLYAEQGNVDTKALLGHATERMSDLYANPRGVEPIRVSITK